ncbi:MAG: ATP-dependent DNA ligase [Candidatus Nanoarchaeia archaeon]|jgi:DNA ligase-1|nr:ATP-dependent DNA ligase [Candidatus Nanoarchaeia archaeon]|tara:strand:+ start:25424 stop:27172 length:1749 start_codon:yes stop_codon:yes gene_type:complete
MDYLTLVEVFEKLEKTSKRLEKTFILSKLLKKTNKEDLEYIIYLVQGRIFPQWDRREMGLSSKLIIKVLNSVTGDSNDDIENIWSREGDLGKVAFILIQKNKQRTLHRQELTVKKVIENLRKLAGLEGKGTVNKKIQLVSELLTSANPLEAKFIIKNILGTLRIGIAEGIVRDGIVWTYFDKEIGFNYNEKENKIDVEREKYNFYVDLVQRAYDITNDYSRVALTIKTKGIEGLSKEKLSPGSPINVMLYPKAEDIEDAFNTIGKPCAFEYKYDGIRLQISKENNGNINIFTRRLENVTKQFPEVVDFVKRYIKAKSFIIDSEAVGYNPKTKKYLPFQSISQRIKRRYDIDSMSKKFPVEVNIFDIIYYNDKNLLNEQFKERRKILEKITKQIKLRLVLAKQLVTGDVKKAEKFYKEALTKGEEGLMAKNLEGIYKPGSRVGYGAKIKPTADSFDLIIVKAEWGEGKRSKWLTSYTIACNHDGELLELGKVSTGLKEKGEGITFDQMTKLLQPLIKEEKGRNIIVKPEIVIEVGYSEIQKSPTYSSGYALRFPRVVMLRPDRSKKDIYTLEDIKKAYNKQKK